MSPSSASGTARAVPLESSRTSVAEELPDELLDKIIRDVGPLYYKPLPPLHMMRDRGCWRPCSQVCRRWHRITVPYLFQFVKLDRMSPGTPQDFCETVSQSHDIAQAIESVSICVEKLCMDTVASVLPLLPQLRYLNIYAGRTMTLSQNPAKLYGHCTLAKLVYDSDADDFVGEVLQLLRLFDDIGELELGSDGMLKKAYGRIEDTESLARAKLRIHSLKLSTLEYFGMASYLTHLCDVHAFDNLTCLSVWVTSLSKLRTLNEMLLRVGATLGELYLYLNLDDDEDTCTSVLLCPQISLIVDKCIVAAASREDAVNNSRSGLAACVALHAFRVEMDSLFRDFEEVDFSLEQVSEYAINDWLLALNLFDLVAELHVQPAPRASRIQHLAFSYKSHQWRHEDQGFEVLPWETMRTVFKRFVSLKSLTVFFNYPYDDEGRLDVDGAELTATEYTYRQLEGFKKILHCGTAAFFGCTQESCRWYTPRYTHNVDLKFKRARRWRYDSAGRMVDL